MKGQLPVFKRCCFCVPLRYGLLVWGYLKMIADACLISFVSYLLINFVKFGISGSKDHYALFYTNPTVAMIVITVFTTDFVATTVFIVGGHKKNVKLIRVFYFFSIGMFAVTLLLTVLSIISSIYPKMTEDKMRYWTNALVTYYYFFAVLAVQFYILLLLRSEIIKLTNKAEYATQCK